MLRKIMRRKVLKDLFLGALSAVLLALSFSGANLEFLAWFAFGPLFFVLRGKNKFQAFLFSYITGLIFWAGTIYWLIHVTLFGQIILILYLALYFGFFGLVVSAYPPSTTYYLLSIPSIWILFEYIRSHLMTGFPWALLGYSQYKNLGVIQIVDITGAYSVSFLIMMVNVLIYQLIFQRRISFSRFIVPILILAGVLFYGYFRLTLPTTYYLLPTKLKISVIQGNISQELKWHKGSRDFIINKYLKLTKEASKDKPDLLIWPEASLPVVLEDEPEYFTRVNNLAEETGIPLLLGAVTTQKGFYYNSAILISPNTKRFTQYNKLHLVPFGEFIPLRDTFPFLQTIAPIGDITSGLEYTVFFLPSSSKLQAPSPEAHFGVLICFEDLFPELSRKFVKGGANFLVNITNDAWYKRTSALEQHFQASVFRAVENRVYLVRSANTGLSGFINPQGRFVCLDKFSDGHYTKEINPGSGKMSFYTRFGDVFVLICGIIIIFSMLTKSKKRKAKSFP
ncbi:MAG: apolipoprotein N-acyltransferase [Candidatus Omnitrophota bacterium]